MQANKINIALFFPYAWLLETLDVQFAKLIFSWKVTRCVQHNCLWQIPDEVFFRLPVLINTAVRLIKVQHYKGEVCPRQLVHSYFCFLFWKLTKTNSEWWTIFLSRLLFLRSCRHCKRHLSSRVESPSASGRRCSCEIRATKSLKIHCGSFERQGSEQERANVHCHWQQFASIMKS